MYRPRDLIVFFNLCIERAVDRPEITAAMIRAAEGDYSARRLRALSDEWFADYPELLDGAEILKKRAPVFTLDTITDSEIIDLCLRIATTEYARPGILHCHARETAETKTDPGEFRARLAGVFYQVGLIGLKTETFTSLNWSFLDAPTIQRTQIEDNAGVAVCPVFYRVLGIDPTQA